MIEPTTVSTVWLEILRAQKPVTYPELAATTANPAFRELPVNKRCSALNTAFRLGYLERSGKPRSYAYRVTPRCTVPPGVPISEILEATT